MGAVGQPQLLHLSVHFAWSHMLRGIGRTVRDVAMVVRTAPSIGRRLPHWPSGPAGNLRLLDAGHHPDAHRYRSPGRGSRQAAAAPPRLGTRVLVRAYVARGSWEHAPRSAHPTCPGGGRPAGEVRARPAAPWQTGSSFKRSFQSSGQAVISERMTGQLLRLAAGGGLRTVVHPDRFHLATRHDDATPGAPARSGTTWRPPSACQRRRAPSSPIGLCQAFQGHRPPGR